ncbi:J domain-containing protein DDB_G0295729 [Xenopus tropicalis]|uniref:J domain-containing protein DDB_G0295729 n=1 Tax=Xenopus tropicalis TaxID=8364 RepID=A0A8J1JK89_XENTR|nr:J domain-containing protein DDB_G0295729 [Xenopus tropicalis]XP_031758294.1 J domain-containing protein DDB_G0295729 [Xenopus tropicalis]
MAGRLRKNSRTDGNSMAQVEPTKSLGIHSFHTNRPGRSDLPAIAGVGLGAPDAKLASVGMAAKPAKTYARPDRIVKSVISRSVQVSFSEGNMFLSQNEALLKENLLLTATLKEKEVTILNLRKVIEEKTLYYTKDLEAERNSHALTRHQLEESQSLVQEKQQLLKEKTLHYEKVALELQNQYEERVTLLQKQSQLEISSRDEKIKKLKQQISELFKENSWEHKQQMDEYQKEVNRLAEEVRSLHLQLKRENTSAKECEQCIKWKLALEDTKLQLKLKNRTIEELQSVCRRFQKQLTEQEKLQNILILKSSSNVK